MSSSSYGFLYNPSLPAEEIIVAHCLSINFARGTTIVDPSTSSVIAWIKYGPNVTIGEARTQDWTAKALHDAGVSDIQVPRVFHAFTADYFGSPIGYIAMEYIDGIDCDSNDVEPVAKAVQTLISLQAPPTATLGHVGCGTASIVHSFFPEWLPNAMYKSDQDFYAHIHNIFRFLGINFQGDISSHGRFLCLSDFNPGNFRKRTIDGRLVVVALDFGATCFMPLPFIEVALRKPRDYFSQLVVKNITYTRSNDATALLSASGPLVQYGWKPHSHWASVPKRTANNGWCTLQLTLREYPGAWGFVLFLVQVAVLTFDTREYVKSLQILVRPSPMELGAQGVLTTKKQKHKREMLAMFPSAEGAVADAPTGLEKKLYESIEANEVLDAERMDLEGIEGRRARAWEQRNKKATRKQVAPAIKAIIEGGW